MGNSFLCVRKIMKWRNQDIEGQFAADRTCYGSSRFINTEIYVLWTPAVKISILFYCTSFLSLYYNKQPSILQILLFLIMRVILIIIATLAHLISTRMTINQRSSLIETSAFWARVHFPIQGGMPPYIYQFTELQKGWKQVNEYIYIPVRDLQFQSEHICRLKAIDSLDNRITASISLIIKSERIFIEGVTYSQDDNFQTSSEFQLRSMENLSTVKIAQGTINNPTKPKTLEKKVSTKIQSQKFGQEVIQKPKVNRKYKENSNQINDDFDFGFEEERTNFFSNGIKKSLPKAVVFFQAEQPAPQPSIPEKSTTYGQFSVTRDVSDQATQKKIEEAVRNATKQIIYPNRSIDEIFRRLPNLQDLDEIILNVDTLSISKTIQTVLVSNMDCNQKISYLSEFFGRIQNHVEMKRLSLEKLKLIKNLSRKQIQRLVIQIQRLHSEKQQLNLKGLNLKLEREIIKLEAAYDKYNQAVAEKGLSEKKLPTYEKTMINLQKLIKKEKITLPEAEEKLSVINGEISELEEKLAKAKEKRNKIKKFVDEKKQKIAAFQKTLQQTINEAKKTSEIIVGAPEKLDSLKRNYLLLEVEVERIRKDINFDSRKQERIYNDIKKTESQIEEEEEKVNEREIETVKNMIDQLLRNLPNIQEQIDHLYYSCYEASQIVQKSTDPTKLPSYLIEPTKFVKYLEMAYGLNTQIKQMNKKSEISLTKSSVFSKVWSEKYGSAYQNIDTVEESQQLIKNDFNCLRPSRLKTCSGEIKFIRKNMIIVSGDDGHVYKLFLGSCSRIESAGSNLPVVGQKIVFKGIQDVQQEFKVYSASSY